MPQQNLTDAQKAALLTQAAQSQKHTEHHKKHAVKHHNTFTHNLTSKMKAMLGHKPSNNTATNKNQENVSGIGRVSGAAGVGGSENQSIVSEEVGNVDGVREAEVKGKGKGKGKKEKLHDKVKHMHGLFKHGAGMPGKMKKELGGS
jgi:hypothetical protein